MVMKKGGSANVRKSGRIENEAYLVTVCISQGSSGNLQDENNGQKHSKLNG